MKANKKLKCDCCGKVKKTRTMMKKKDKIYCSICYRKQSKCLMPIYNGKIPKSVLPPKKKVRKKAESKPPKIKGAKERKSLHKGLKRGFGLFLTLEEKQVLFKKFVSNGISNPAERVKKVCEKMSELAKKLRQEAKDKKTTQEQMQKRFIEELEKYAQEEMR